jgi:hypothetical protein
VIDLVLSYMEARPVRVHRGRSAERLLQPFIAASGKRRERDAPRLGELLNVVIERLASQ